jgi:hypothetical protein
VIRRRLILAALAALTLPAVVGCSGDTTGSNTPGSSVPPKDIPACAEVYAEGKKITLTDFGQACVQDNGELITPLPVRIRCEDDRRLFWNDLAWGYENDVMQLTPVRKEIKIPDALEECVSSEPAAPAA